MLTTDGKGNSYTVHVFMLSSECVFDAYTCRQVWCQDSIKLLFTLINAFCYTQVYQSTAYYFPKNSLLCSPKFVFATGHDTHAPVHTTCQTFSQQKLSYVGHLERQREVKSCPNITTYGTVSESIELSLQNVF